MQDIVIDFESYYDNELTVKRFGNLNYLANTNAYLVAVVARVGDGPETRARFLLRAPQSAP
jgi:hypothetical protein